MPAVKKGRAHAMKHAPARSMDHGKHTRFEEPAQIAPEEGQAAGAAGAALDENNQEWELSSAGDSEAALGDFPASRQEVIEGLPAIGMVNELIATNNAISVKLVALRSGPASKGYYDETATYDKICEAEAACKVYLNDALYDMGDGYTLKDLSPDGKINLAAARSGNTKNRRNGQIVVRIDEEHLEYFMMAIEGVYTVAPPDPEELEYEAMASDTFYPGAILEQIHAQNGGVHATVRYSREAKANCFMWSFESEEDKDEAEARGYIIKLGKEHGTMAFRPIQKKIQMEECFLYGFTGPASAKDLFLPLYAQEVGCSKDLARISRAQGIRDGVGTVIKITFPYSKSSYKRFMKLIAIERFKLVIEGHALEVTIAMTPVELGKILAFRLMAEEEEEEQEEITSAIDLRIEDVTPACKSEAGKHATLMPKCTWKPYAKVGVHSWYAMSRTQESATFEPISPPTHHRDEEERMRKTPEEKMHSCAYEMHELDSHADDGLHWQRISNERAKRHEAKRDEAARQALRAGADEARMGWARQLLENEGGGARSRGCHWEVRSMDHLLRWGYDARACGGGKSK